MQVRSFQWLTREYVLLALACGHRLVVNTTEADSAFANGTDCRVCGAPPACGCSACRQNWIETGESACVVKE